MLIKFTSGGRGGGGAVCNYLVDAERTGREHCPPEVVRGDLARKIGRASCRERV